MASNKDLIINIIANNKTKPGFQAAAGGVRSITSAIGALGLAKFGKDSVQAFKDVTSQSLGLKRAMGGTVEEASRMRFAASRAGQDMGQFTTSVTRLGKNLAVAAQTGSGPVATTMDKLGVSFKTADGHVQPLVQVLPDIAEGFKQMPDGAEKSAAAMALFGKSGATMLPFLNRGKAGIQDLMGQTEKFNQLVGSAQVDAYMKNLNAQRDLEQQMTGLKNKFGEAILPVLTQVVEVGGKATEVFAQLPQPVKMGGVVAVGAALGWNMFGGAIQGVGGGLQWLYAKTVTSTTATVADTAATKANTNAKIENAAAGKNAGGLAGFAKGASALVGVVAVAGAVVEVVKKLDEVTRSASQSGNQLASSWGQITDFGMRIAPIIGQVKAGLNINREFDAWRNGTVDIEAFGQATQGVAGIVESNTSRAVNAIAQMSEQTGVDYNEIIASNDELRGKLEAVGYTAGMSIDDFKQLGSAAAEVGQEALDAAGSVDDFAKALQAIIAPGMAMSKAADEQVQALRGVTAAAKENGTQLTGNSEKAMKNREAIRSAINANLEHATAVARVKNSVDAGKQAFDQSTQKLIRQARAAGMSENAVRKMVAGIQTANQTKLRGKNASVRANIKPLQSSLSKARRDLNALKQSRSPEVRAKVAKLQADLKKAQRNVNELKQTKKPDVTAVDKASAKVRTIREAINSLRDKQVNITVNRKETSNKAVGGKAGGPVIVGERGPEFIWLPEGSHVDTASETRRQREEGIEHFAKGKKGKSKKKDTAAQKKIRDKIKNALSSAQSVLSSLKSDRDSRVSSITSSALGFTGISGWSSSENDAKKQELLDSQDEVAEARTALNRAAIGTAERSEAQVRLGAAMKRLEAANANKPETVAQWMRKRVAAVALWVSNIKKLKNSWGKTAAGKALIQEVYEAGPENGAALSNELLKSPADLKDLINSQTQASNLAREAAAINPYVIDANAKIKAQTTLVNKVEVTLKLDGKSIHKALLNLKKSQGGKSLGL